MRRNKRLERAVKTGFQVSLELVEKEIIVEAMHEARSKDELCRKIYHEPEGSIGVLRVKLIHSSFYIFFREKYIDLNEGIRGSKRIPASEGLVSVRRLLDGSDLGRVH